MCEKNDNIDLDIHVKIENIHSHDQENVIEDCNVDEVETKDNISLGSLHKDTDNIKVDNNVNHQSDIQLIHSSWRKVTVDGGKNCKYPDDIPITESHNFKVGVEVKAEICVDNDISVKVERIDDSTDSNKHCNEDVENNIVNNAAIIGEEWNGNFLARNREANIDSIREHQSNQINNGLPQQQNIGEIESRNELPQLEGNIESLICSKCNYKTSDERHIQCLICSGDKIHICNICNKSFRYKNKIIAHLRIHTGEKPFPCNVCNKAFRIKNKLKNHLRIHSGEKPYTCVVCDRGFFDSSNLRYHMTTHSSSKPFLCDVCKKTFTFSSGLQRHMKIHTGDKPYSCDVCEKTFNEKCNLQRHLRVHSGERPYSCKICKRTFIENGHLHIHMRTHSGEKPYSCDVCNKRFSIKSGLQRHSRIHTGDKPYSCDICERHFNEKGNLLKHVRQCNNKMRNKKLLQYIPEIICLKRKGT